MGNQKEGTAPAAWDIDTTLIYCDICIREIQLGNRPTTHFTKEGWKNLLKNFNERTGRSYDRTQLKNKWDQLKKDWKQWKDLLRGETEIGWNPIRKTIDASNDWWTEKLQVMPNAKKFRYNVIPPELEEKLDLMFSRIVATGENVWIPSSGVLPPDLNDDHIISSEEDYTQDEQTNLPHITTKDPTTNYDSQKSQQSSSFLHKRKRLRTPQSGTRQLFLNHVEDLVDAAKSISSAISTSNEKQKSFTILDVLEEISKIPDIFDDFELYDFATEYFKDKNNRDIFMVMPIERRLWWLRRRFDRNFC